jgi:hypothetical protein
MPEQLTLPLHGDFAEVPDTAILCQRWRDGRHSWRTDTDRFDPRRYQVREIGETAAKAYVIRAHYSRSFPAARLRYGMYERDRLVGVAVFGVPMDRRVLTGAFPSLEPYVESLELSRFVLDDDCPGNSESWFLARCFRGDPPGRPGCLRGLPEHGVHGVVSFSDPAPRRAADGTITMPGHIGRIYQATNSVYTGRGTPRTLTLLPDGSTLNDRAKQKVRRQEQGHEYVERLLIAWGARVPRASEDMAAWLAEALEDVRARRLRHRGNHRYVFPLGRSARDRAKVKVGYAALSYPKDGDLAA